MMTTATGTQIVSFGCILFLSIGLNNSLSASVVVTALTTSFAAAAAAAGSGGRRPYANLYRSRAPSSVATTTAAWIPTRSRSSSVSGTEAQCLPIWGRTLTVRPTAWSTGSSGSRSRWGWVGPLCSTSGSDDTSNDEGAKLAAELFLLAQRKGIRLDSDDMEDDEDDDEDENDTERAALRSVVADGVDEEDDDDDDDEPEPNIPQGAINAFLGYDTGNVGERLAGNVTLTNDQLYSEVKERVLESSGGFLSYVKRADDDDDDDDETETDMVATPPPPKPYQAPTIVPDSDLTAGEVVIQVLDALVHNNVPTPNRGVEILFGYSSPGSQIRNEVGLTPAEYADFLQETEYKVLFAHDGCATIDKADYSVDGKKAFFTARLVAGPSPLDTVSVNFILSTTGREEDACWLIDSILIRPQSMRRRRRK